MDYSIVIQLTWAAHYVSFALVGVGFFSILLAVVQHRWQDSIEYTAYLISVIVALLVAYVCIMTYQVIDVAPSAASAVEAESTLSAWVWHNSNQQLLFVAGLTIVLGLSNWFFQHQFLPRSRPHRLGWLLVLLLTLMLGGILLGGLSGYYGLLEEYHRNNS